MEKEHHNLAHVKKTRHVENKTGFSLTDKIFITILVGSIIYVGYLFFQEDIIRLLQMNPYVWSFFTHITNEISQKTMVGLFYASFFGALFFVFLPIEVLFLYYVSLGYSVPVIIALTIIGNLMGLFLDYLFGFVLGARMLKFFLRSKFEKFHNMTEKWGGVIVVVGNIIPFPIQLASVIIGAARYSFVKFVIFTFLGLFVKLFALIMLRTYILTFFS